jgi:hypothetical protein
MPPKEPKVNVPPNVMFEGASMLVWYSTAAGNTEASPQALPEEVKVFTEMPVELAMAKPKPAAAPLA